MTLGDAIVNQGSVTHGLEPMVLVGVAAILTIAKLSGELFERIRQPAVLGELVGGIVVGNLTLIGFKAFAAGLVLDEAHFQSIRSREELRLEQLLAPVSGLLVPLFFVLMGFRVDLKAFARVDLILFAAALTGAALIGKQVCALAVVERNPNRIAIGIGMIHVVKLV